MASHGAIKDCLAANKEKGFECWFYLCRTSTLPTSWMMTTSSRFPASSLKDLKVCACGLLAPVHLQQNHSFMGYAGWGIYYAPKAPESLNFYLDFIRPWASIEVSEYVCAHLIQKQGSVHWVYNALLSNVIMYVYIECVYIYIIILLYTYIYIYAYYSY